MANVEERIVFDGTREARGPDVAEWFREAARVLIDPIIDVMRDELGPPTEYAPHDFYRSDTWTISLSTATPRDHYTFYDYTPEKLGKVLKKVEQGRLASVDLSVTDILPVPVAQPSPELAALLGDPTGAAFAGLTAASPRSASIEVRLERMPGPPRNELHISVPGEWIPGRAARDALDAVIAAARSVAARPAVEAAEAPEAEEPETPAPAEPHELRVVDTGEYAGVDVTFLLKTSRELARSERAALDAALDRWYSRWVANDAATVHDMTPVEFDLDEKGPGGAWTVDFGSAGDEAMNELVDELRSLARSGLPAFELVIGA